MTCSLSDVLRIALIVVLVLLIVSLVRSACEGVKSRPNESVPMVGMNGEGITSNTVKPVQKQNTVKVNLNLMGGAGASRGFNPEGFQAPTGREGERREVDAIELSQRAWYGM